MTDSSEFLWSLFVAAAVGFVVLVIAFATALVLAQRRFLKLQQAYGQHLLHTQDEERAWVAREVHDDVAQRIAVLRHELDLLRRESGSADAPAERRRFDGLAEEIEDLGVAVRRLAHRLHPATLDQGDLRLALEQLAEDARRAYGLQVQLEIGMVPDLRSSGLALVVYRIGQESLRNIARHAGVTSAKLGIQVENGRLVMQIRDEGKGFDPSRGSGPGKPRGLGLLSIQERAGQVSGTASIVSRPGAGTTVIVNLPLRGRRGR
jgi:signal transduction histidine kinase